MYGQFYIHPNQGLVILRKNNKKQLYHLRSLIKTEWLKRKPKPSKLPII